MTTQAVKDQTVAPAKPAEKDQVDKPKMFVVVLHNDNSSSPEFVTQVLAEAFNVTNASSIMMKAHCEGTAVVMASTYEICETRLDRAQAMIASARSGKDYFAPNSRTGMCELTFSINPETAGK